MNVNNAKKKLKHVRKGTGESWWRRRCKMEDAGAGSDIKTLT
jgi:hypothetical protein